MTMFSPFKKLLWTASLGGLAALGLGVGCVITVGPQDCSECGNTGCNSQEVNGECLCDPGYEFANSDPNDFDCDRIPGKGGDANCGGEPNTSLEGDVCVCDAGYNWCNPADLNDLSCCPDNNQATGGGGTGGTDDGTGGTADDADTTVDDTGTGPGEMCLEEEPPFMGFEPDPADCVEEGLYFCSNPEAMGPAGSRFWICEGGAWVEYPSWADEDCQFQNFAFGYGCIDTESEGVVSVCGDGPGTACNGPACDACANDDVLNFCVDGKLGSVSCVDLCTQEGIDGITFDTGVCIADDISVDCFCCDEGDEGCPL